MAEPATILDHVGNTPLLKLKHVTDSLRADIYVKCEFTNPGGSIKDRMALRMIEEAERRGDLRPGGTIVDQSTGNTGPALSFVGGVKGYNVRLFLPAQLGSAYNPADRIRIARLYGCEVTPIDLDEHVENADQLEGLERAATFVAIRMKHCYDLQQSDSSHWWANQLCNVDNTAAHREHTGAEILNQIDGAIDGWVASVGTGGTLLGVAEALKDHYPVVENPRTTRVRKIVLDAAAVLLIEEGHHAVTPHRVSKVTGIARSTIYRHWPDPVSLLMDAIDSALAPDYTLSTIGDVRADLTTALESIRLRLNRRPFRALFAALLDNATRSKELIPAQRRFVTGVTAPLQSIVAEAMDDGRLDPSIKLQDVVAQLAGPLFHQHVMLQARITNELIANTIKGVVVANEVPTTSGRL